MLSGIFMGLLRRCITKLVEINERFGDREEEWGVVTGRWDGGIVAVWWGGVSPILGMLMVRARWSLWLVLEVVMEASVGRSCVVGGRHRSQWSSGEFVGMNVGVWGSPLRVRDVALQRSSRGAR